MPFELLTVDLNVLSRHLILMLIAYVLALPIAWDRERQERTAGLRTFPLVALASCGYALVGFSLMDEDAQGRVVQGLITGMGFIGGGAILKSNNGVVYGTATAASLWGTGAIGLAVAAQRLEVAVAISVLTFMTLYFLRSVKQDIESENEEAPGGSVHGKSDDE
ncbi:MAG: MgtC/SapB family protein [Pseudomonadaceae bacterium]|nr:MgtC/SapB family protein [Pseudomonadaceae bacterium]